MARNKPSGKDDVMTDQAWRCRRGLAAGLIVLILTLLAPLGALAAQSAARGGTGSGPSAVQPAAWSSPTKVGTGFHNSVSQVVDSTNHVVIAATGHGGLWYITNRSGSWTQTKVLSDLPNRSYRDVSVALDPSDRVYIAVERSSCDDCTPGGSDGIFLVSDKGLARGTFPSSPTKIAPAGSGEPSLKVGHGHLFLATVKPCCIPGPYPSVYLRTNATGSWTGTQVAKHGESPQLRIASDGRPRIAFSRAAGITYAVAHTTTGSFTVSDVPGAGSYDTLVGLALDSNDRPHIVWIHGTTTTHVAYDWRTASGWHAAETVVGLSDTDNAVAFDMDSLGRPNIAVGGAKVRAFVRIGGSWPGSTVATSSNVDALVLRRAFSGRVVIAWSNFGGGLFVSKN